MAQARRKGIANSRYINEFMKLNTSLDFAVVLQVALNSTTSDSAVDNVKDSFYINALHLSNNFANK